MVKRKQKPTRNGYRSVSARTGLNVGHISRIMNGKRNASFATICLLADGMGLSIDRLRRMIEDNRQRGVPEEVSRRISDGVKRAMGRSSGDSQEVDQTT